MTENPRIDVTTPNQSARSRSHNALLTENIITQRWIIPIKLLSLPSQNGSDFMLSRRLLRIKVLKALYAHLQSQADNMIASEKALIASVDKAYDLYIHLLTLITEIAAYAEERQEIAKRKQLATHEDLHPNRRFVENRVVRLIADSETIAKITSERKLSWKENPELIKTLYNQLIESDYYKAYMANPQCSFREDARLVQTFYTKELEECAALEETLEEQSILWNDDLGFALLMVLRTLSNMRQSNKDVRLLPKFKSEDDLIFTRTLFQKTLIGYNDAIKTVEGFLHNWDLERIACMDNIIMAMAMTELEYCETIPVKVTLDEYIEISKYYSTRSSGLFINGVLDRVIERFTAEGRINKSGIGLL